MESNLPHDVRCSFCGSDRTAAAMLLVAGDAAICDGCLENAGAALWRRRHPRAARLAAWLSRLPLTEQGLLLHVVPGVVFAWFLSGFVFAFCATTWLAVPLFPAILAGTSMTVLLLFISFEVVVSLMRPVRTALWGLLWGMAMLQLAWPFGFWVRVAVAAAGAISGAVLAERTASKRKGAANESEDG